MTKFECDRCHVDVTTATGIHVIEIEDDSIDLCDGCFDQLGSFLRRGH